jgi:S-methylmethionine-dependent homocysteine/selenocysteine methylase
VAHNNKPLVDGHYLTDGGLETTLIFHKGMELPHFAAFELLKHPDGKNALSEYYAPYLQIAQNYGLNFILETPT